MFQFRFLGLAMGLAVVVAGCGDKKSSTASKPAEPTGAAGTAAAAPPPLARTVGPIDLDAATLDLPALFPGTEYELYPADLGGDYPVDTASIARDGRRVVEAALEGDRVVRLRFYDPALASPAGVKAGQTAVAAAARVPDATCALGPAGDDGDRLHCGSPRDPGCTYQLGHAPTVADGARMGTVPAEVTIERIVCALPPGKQPRLAERPAIIVPLEDLDLDEDEHSKPGKQGEEPDPMAWEINADVDEENGPYQKRSANAMEIQRCARLLTLTSACGLRDDSQTGWLADPSVKPVPRGEADGDCEVGNAIPVNGYYEFPARVLRLKRLEAIEQAATRGCGALRAALDQHDPRKVRAGTPAPR